ncbi:hypothetical protein D5366_04250 [Neokomagataea tanensis]|uniref:Auto-transporter adhesin head GIN domain-containing protein n=1 Tax=Neokomagataea tanensis TaxID=661191 RepID=A0A4Y6V3E4_9PROT|nr:MULTISPECIES: hypothetical protein [Neokomagataea]QDH24579.1 hypothetical protein D5366_04250 [Neokomagataea tanensis]
MQARTTYLTPITLRKAHTQLLRALCAATLLTSTLALPAHAARITMSGEDLDLTVPCSGSVRIIVDPSMKDGATLDSTNATQVMLRGGKDEAESRISISTKSCAPDGHVTISVSPITGISIHDSRDTHFTISGKLASLDASLDSNTLNADNIQSLDLSMRGNSAVHIKTLDRAAQIVASGNTSFSADYANLTAFSAQLSNDATLNVAQGTIEALTLVTADNASATLASTASLATVTANGTGAVSIAHVSGPVMRSGTGNVHVGDVQPAPAVAVASTPAVAAPPNLVQQPAVPTPPAPAQPPIHSMPAIPAPPPYTAPSAPPVIAAPPPQIQLPPPALPAPPPPQTPPTLPTQQALPSVSVPSAPKAPINSAPPPSNTPPKEAVSAPPTPPENSSAAPTNTTATPSHN